MPAPAVDRGSPTASGGFRASYPAGLLVDECATGDVPAVPAAGKTVPSIPHVVDPPSSLTLPFVNISRELAPAPFASDKNKLLPGRNPAGKTNIIVAAAGQLNVPSRWTKPSVSSM